MIIINRESGEAGNRCPKCKSPKITFEMAAKFGPNGNQTINNDDYTKGLAVSQLICQRCNYKWVRSLNNAPQDIVELERRLRHPT